MIRLVIGSLIILSIITVSVFGIEPEIAGERPATTVALDVDNGTYVNANRVLMFVTNQGSFGRDLDGFFGNVYGTYCPYVSDEAIRNGTMTKYSPLWTAGLWIGGTDSVTGDVRVSASEYTSDYVSGPMAGGTYQSDNPSFRIYKLYADSLEGNPNTDYLNWPSDQGAPIDERGRPIMIGDQMLWTVFNDADPSAHISSAGGEEPLGVEVQLTVWAVDDVGTDTLTAPSTLPVARSGSSDMKVVVELIDEFELTGDTYEVITANDVALGKVWSLINVTTGTTLLSDQTDFSTDSATDTIDGFQVWVIDTSVSFASFEVVANGSGVLDLPQPGALHSAGFPTPGDADPGADQQVSSGRWAIHTGDNGGTSGGGDRGPYTEFLTRTFRKDPARVWRLGEYDFEIRFTGSNDNPGVGGSYCWEWAMDLSTYWVPFEIWRTGIGTPDDPNDDVRLLPYIFGDGGTVYNMSSYGSDADGTCGPGGCEHSASGGDDDPYTGDWLYWRLPVDTTPGEAGYLAFEAEMLSNPGSRVDDALPIMDRMVLINVDAGVLPPFDQDMPEQGTVFRLTTAKGLVPDTFSFVAEPPATITSGPEGVAVYLEYILRNKGSRTIKSCYVSVFADPDVGSAGDDLSGCDTLSDIYYCYNSTNTDEQYGEDPPAVGFRMVHGPLVPRVGDTAIFSGEKVPNFSNTGMTSYWNFRAPVDYPQNATMTYHYMRGINPYTLDTASYEYAGDPVSGTGELDSSPSNRSMLATSGPFDFRPGDSQYVMIKMAVGFGEDNLASITKMKEILNLPYSSPTDVADGKPDNLPNEFDLGQNYPNPFNPSTTISYSLAERSDVRITVYNILGQEVITLVNERRPAGRHEVVWSGEDASGGPVSSGIYFYRIVTDGFVGAKKMLLLK